MIRQPAALTYADFWVIQNLAQSRARCSPRLAANRYVDTIRSGRDILDYYITDIFLMLKRYLQQH